MPDDAPTARHTFDVVVALARTILLRAADDDDDITVRLPARELQELARFALVGAGRTVDPPIHTFPAPDWPEAPTTAPDECKFVMLLPNGGRMWVNPADPGDRAALVGVFGQSVADRSAQQQRLFGAALKGCSGRDPEACWHAAAELVWTAMSVLSMIGVEDPDAAVSNLASKAGPMSAHTAQPTQEDN